MLSVRSLKQNNITIIIINILLIIITIFPSILSIFHSPIAPDSGYYLSVIERISEGLVPYSDFKLGYTPLYFYILVFTKSIFNINISYEFYLTIHYLFFYIGAYLVFKITQIITNNKPNAFYAAILYSLMAHWNEGNAVLLEVPSIMFGLLGIYIILKANNSILKLIVAGVCFSFSFLTKQYGLGFLILGLIYLIYDSTKFKFFIYLIFAFLIPIIISILIFGRNYVTILLGDGYGSNISISTIYIIFERTRYLFLRIAPSLLICFLFYPIIFRKALNNKYFVTFSLGLFGFMLQFAFGSFQHYYLYVLPFVSILLFYILSYINKFKTIYIMFLIITFSLNLYSTYNNRVYKIYIKSKHLKIEQIKLANIIQSNVPINANLYIADIGLIPQYYLSNRIPPNLNTMGYTFGIALNPEQHLQQIKSANYILKYQHEYNDFDLNANNVKSELKKYEFILLNNDVLLYKKY